MYEIKKSILPNNFKHIMIFHKSSKIMHLRTKL